MSRSVVAKGKNVQDAVELALQLLSAKREQVDIEIVEMETKGIFGIGGKPAVVKVVVKENAPTQTPVNTAPAVDAMELLMSSIESLEVAGQEQLGRDSVTRSTDHVLKGDVEGKVWVKNSVIYCKDSENKYPTLSTCPEVIVYKNDEVVEGMLIISEKDRIRIEVKQGQIPTRWEIRLDPERIKATLQVEPGTMIQRKLMDLEPEEHLELIVEETRITQNDMNINAVMDKLSELGIVQGINHLEIKKACETLDAATFTIATGIEPQQGRHGYLELLVDLEVEQKGLSERRDGTVNFRDFKRIPTVNKGEVVAIVHPPVEGRAGLTVTGITLFPAPVYPMVVKTGKGIILMEDGSKVVAIESGRPQFQIRGTLAKVSILDKLFHPQDVDIASGNIRFTGDVEIGGNVEEGMEVLAEGDIVLQKNVNMSKITSGNSILIKGNVINSEIVAGKSNLLIAECAQLLGEMSVTIKHIIAAVEQLYRTPAFKTSDITKIGLSSLLKILLESKFKSFPLLVKQYNEKTKEGKEVLDEEWINFANRLYLAFFTIHPGELKGIEDLVRIKDKLIELHQFSVIPPDPNSSIHLPYALNSRIYCSGDVFINGQGCYNTKIHAGGALKITGFIRGGEIYAGFGADITEVGTKGGVPTKIVVPHDRGIRIRLAMEDTVVQVGKRQHKFLQETKNIYARLNEKNELLLF
ncbi:MAG TPA: FapA family protein [Candidatus Bathyarchaeia archaeon]|nr:FapA family protein [Candidatus Bathyarchaeia archaeon]